MRDHDHLTGKYGGAADERCNLMFAKKFKVQVFFQKIRGYESYLIVLGFVRSRGSTSN